MEKIEKICNEYGFVVAIIALAVLALFIIVCVSFYINLKKKKELINEKNNEIRICQKQQSKLLSDYNKLYSIYKQQEQQLLKLNKELKSCVNHSYEPTIDEIKEKSYKYLRTAINGAFQMLYDTEDKCYFRTWREKDCLLYEFYGIEEKAINNFDAVLVNTCEYSGDINTAKRIENIEPGILSSDLRIKKQAKIKFIS